MIKTTRPRVSRRSFLAGMGAVAAGIHLVPRRAFSRDGADDPVDALDDVRDPEATFGSYRQLTSDAKARARAPKRRLRAVH